MYVDDEGEEHPHLSQSLLYQLSNTATVVKSIVECKCFQLDTAIVYTSPWNGSSLVVWVRLRQIGLNGTPKKTSLLSRDTMRQPSWRWSSGHLS